MSYYSLLYQSVGPIDALKVVSVDSVLYVSTNGNDTSGTGSTADPFRTLQKAMDYAREHLILGNATLTIRLLPGEYTVSENLDLYHPQGSNIVIEGDPSAFSQRTLWRVQNYTWNLANFAGGGHTGTLSLFDGTTTAGCTFHGFTTSDNGMYFSITNAAIGSRSGYQTVGASATAGVSAPSASSYDPLFWGDRFFNHGYSYEEANAVLGLGRILNAGTSPHTISAQFSNLNYDGRCPAWHLNGGLNNATPVWGGLANNYPETQYSQPNGYYGTSGWRNESGNVAFPSNPSVTHITPDPLVLSTYPVVIRAAYGKNSGSLFLKNGSLKGLRNIMFASNETPYTLQNGITGATANYSQAISAFTDNGLAHDTNGVALCLENATIGIRHLGFNGVGTAISAHGSKITKYVEQTVDTSGVTASVVRYATLGNLDNAPVLCTANCTNGIVAKNSIIDLTDASGINREYLTDHREGTVYVSALSKPISLFGSEFKATSVVANSHSHVPTFKMDLVVPQFSGITSFTFITQVGSTGYWTAYPLAKAYMNVAGVGRQEIGAVYFITESAEPISQISGTTIGASYVGSTPVGYRRYTFHGLKTAPTGLNQVNVHDVRSGITTPFGVAQYGGTLEVEFYSDNSGTSVVSYYAIGRESLVLRGITGSTFGVNGTTGSTFANYVQSFNSYGTDGTYLGNYFTNRKTTVQAFDGSSVMIEKALVIDNGGAVPVEVAKNSSLIVGDGIISGNKRLDIQNSGQTDGTFGSINYNTGAICITGYAYAGVHCWDNSSVVIGTLFTKHATPVNCFEDADLSVGGKVIKLDHGCRGVVGSLYSLLPPATSAALAQSARDTSLVVGRGLWKSFQGVGYGFIPFDPLRLNGYLLAERCSVLVLELGVGSKVFHFDGGSPNWTGIPTPRNLSLITAKQDSSILFGNCQNSSVDFSQTNLSSRLTTDIRPPNQQRIATRSNGANITVYGTTGITRAWVGELGSSSNYATNDVNVGNYSFMLSQSSGSGQNDVLPLAGVTYCASFSGFSKIIPI